MVSILVENWSADVNAINASGETPLHEAVNRIDVEIADILLRNGADVNIKSTRG
jgi:ankyrin repeat protein